MKFTLGTLAVLAVALLVAPVMAADNSTFQALNQVSIDQQTAAMSDTELAKVEGQGLDVCLICVNYANVKQRNSNTQVNALGALQFNGAHQSNGALVVQKIN